MIEKGVTLIELMVTLAIMAIFMTIAVPSFQQIMSQNTLTTLTNDYLGALNYARSEAVKRGTPISLCPSSNGTACTGAWNDGWLVIDDNAGTPLRVHDALGSRYHLTSALVDAGGTPIERITYTRSGTATTTGTITVCSEGGTTAKNISVTLTQPRATDDSTITTCP